MVELRRRCLVAMAAAFAQKAGQGGHAWFVLQYLLGFRELGWDVLLIDSIGPEACVDTAGDQCPMVRSVAYSEASRLLREFGFDRDYCLLKRGTDEAAGMDRREVENRLERTRFLLNVNGFLTDRNLLESCECRVFLDIDPGVFQFWDSLGLTSVLDGHHFFATVGQNVGEQGCLIPSCGYPWIRIKPPVALRYWPRVESWVRPFSSVCSWRGSFGPIDVGGRRFKLRAHEFRRFLRLPGLSGDAFQVALAIHPDETRDLRDLRQEGWILVDPSEVAGSPSLYRRFVQESLAEFSIAKNLYVDSNSGWLSDRTVCYLASGKPAVVQDTGVRDGDLEENGMLFFSSLEEAMDCVKRVRGDYPRLSRKARELAVELFEARRVLSKLLQALGWAGSPTGET